MEAGTIKKIIGPLIPPKKHVYLEGPKSRSYELIFAWRVFTEFIKGFRTLHFAGPCITVFGSARFKEDHPYYAKAREFGKQIAQMGFTTMTGGGPGIMEAANRGAFENGGSSVGCNIQLPFEQHPNPYVHRSITFEHFFVRKTLLIKYSYAFIIMPGGFGTIRHSSGAEEACLLAVGHYGAGRDACSGVVARRGVLSPPLIGWLTRPTESSPRPRRRGYWGCARRKRKWPGWSIWRTARTGDGSRQRSGRNMRAASARASFSP